MSSKKTSERPDPELLDLEAGLPTTAEDVAALRRLRQPRYETELRDLDRLRADRLGDFRPSRKTSLGWEPFEL